MKASRGGSMTGILGILFVAALSAALADLLHELGHLAATALPVGVSAKLISTIGVSTDGSSALVAAAGPVANLILAPLLSLAFARSASPAWRYFGWLFGSCNLFNATAYLIYSAASATGDWAVAFGALAPPAVWRPIAGVTGCLLYAASVSASVAALRALCVSGIVAASNVERYCAWSYLCGGIVLTAAAALNPLSPWYILTSGAATGFGAMAGLMVLPVRLRRSLPPTSARCPASRCASVGRGSRRESSAAAIFVGVFGPGLRLGRESTPRCMGHRRTHPSRSLDLSPRSRRPRPSRPPRPSGPPRSAPTASRRSSPSRSCR